ncbi:hypothetical protein Neosp_008916 [[Neocosmospora] mangrovei]
MSSQDAYQKTAEEWEYHRDVITYLYVYTTRDNMMRTMQDEFGFRATTSMYSKKLKEWGVKKYYSSRDKDKLAALVSKAHADGQDPRRMLFRGQIVKLHRVLRHCRAKTRDGGSFAGLQPGSLASHAVNRPSRHLGVTSPGEVILLSTKAYIQNYVTGCHVDYRATARFVPSQTSCGESLGPPPNAQTNQFWHDFETAVYLLRIGSMALGWSTFHTCWGTATDNLLPQPLTLLRKVMTTLHPQGGLTRYPEVSRLTLAFIADLLEMKLGTSHPLSQICRHVWRDSEGPRTAEYTLALMSSLFEENLGVCHHETFLTDTALIARHLQNGNVAAAERSARRLVQKSELSPNRASQLPKALRQLAHVLTTLGQYQEAIEVQEGILDCPGAMISRELRIYTMEDIAELHRLQGDFFMESESLREALLAAREFFGRGQAPTLHIWDKFAASMSKQGRAFEGM